MARVDILKKHAEITKTNGMNNNYNEEQDQDDGSDENIGDILELI